MSVPYWQTITKEMHELLVLLGQQSFMGRFYMAGGTALALQLGHRRSIDLDFFSENDEVGQATRQEIIRAFQSVQSQVIENVDGNLLLLINGIHVGLFSYPYPLVGEQINIENVTIASISDIGMMKCDALITRGARKDFYDLYFLNRQVSFQQLFEYGKKKYTYYRDFPLTVMELMVSFDNADKDIQPILYEDIPWVEVKKFFINEAAHLGKAWLKS